MYFSKEYIQNSLVVVHQYGGRDATCKRSVHIVDFKTPDKFTLKWFLS